MSWYWLVLIFFAILPFCICICESDGDAGDRVKYARRLSEVIGYRYFLYFYFKSFKYPCKILNNKDKYEPLYDYNNKRILILEIERLKNGGKPRYKFYNEDVYPVSSNVSVDFSTYHLIGTRASLMSIQTLEKIDELYKLSGECDKKVTKKRNSTPAGWN